MISAFHSAYFREGQHYLFSEIRKKFSLDDETAKKRINLLRRCNILKIVKKEKLSYSDLSDQEIIINEPPEDSSDFEYAFNFVGIILLENLVLKCFPKYIDNTNEKNDAELLQKLKTIIKVIKKYNEQSQEFYLYNGEEKHKTFNSLAISLHILQDYFENGLYTNQKENIELNGEGEILWNKTIDETFAFIKNKTPYYLDFYTRENEDNEFDFIRRLHAAIITKCSNELKNAGILNLFDLNEANLTQETIEDFGNVDFIKYRLEKELKTQFVTRKQNLLKTLYTYVSEAESKETSETFSFYGTNAFNLVWEKACAEIFESVRDKTFRELKKKNIIEEKSIKNPNHDLDNSAEEYLKDSEPFKNLIEKIKWTFNNFAVHAAETLEPDIISIHGNNFFILDAKYYLLSIDENGISHQPGIQDVVKQFAYHKAFLDFVNDFGFENIVNAFLVPKRTSSEYKLQENFRIAGKAELSLMQDYALKSLSPIQIVELEPEFVYENYLESKKITKELTELLEKKKEVFYSKEGEEFLSVAETENNTISINNVDSSNQKSKTYNIRHGLQHL